MCQTPLNFNWFPFHAWAYWANGNLQHEHYNLKVHLGIFFNIQIVKVSASVPACCSSCIVTTMSVTHLALSPVLCASTEAAHIDHHSVGEKMPEKLLDVGFIIYLIIKPFPTQRFQVFGTKVTDDLNSPWTWKGMLEVSLVDSWTLGPLLEFAELF